MPAGTNVVAGSNVVAAVNVLAVGTHVTVTAIAKWFTDSANWHGADGIPHRLAEHLSICGLSLLVALAVSLPVGITLGHLRKGGTLAENIANLGRAVPSLAILIVAVPIVGIGARPAELALVALSIPPLLTNAYVGMAGVDEDVRDAARGLGMTGWQAAWRAELPLALPFILAGVRTAAFQVVATATLAAVVAYGGLGRYIVDGLAVRDNVEVVCGSILVVALAVAVEVLIAGLQRVIVAPPLRTTHRSTHVNEPEELTDARVLEPTA
jgi:osmoprotectant transport system permease protein